MQRPAKPFTPVRFRLQPPKNMIKVAIIGLGFVGNALANSFRSNTEVLKIDPKLGTSVEDLILFKADLIFICLPTPMKDDGDQDTSIIENEINNLKNINISCPIVIKSTVLPEVLTKLHKQTKSLVYNPEFLREKHANEDLLNAKFNILGGNKDITKSISDFYDNHSLVKNLNHIYMDLVTASFFKYSINSFLSLKVIFFNELNSLFNKIDSEISWDEFVEHLKNDKRIGDSHMNVPGHDGRYGYGGACFPKDSSAFLKFSIKNDSELKLLNESIGINNNLRSGYNSLIDREIEQNITFKNK